MEQTEKKFGKLWWVTAIVAVLMAFLFAVETPLCAYADSVKKGKYIDETVMITAKSKTEAESKVATLSDTEGKTYYLFDTPIYNLGGLQTYIAYTATDNEYIATRAIKTMYMKGGWSYSEYNTYLDNKMTEVNTLAEDLYNAILEYADNVRNKKENALYAKKILEYFKEDDSTRNVSNFFIDLADKKEYENVKDDLIKFMMQANTSILQTIERALMIACSDSYEGQNKKDINFLTGLESPTFLEGLGGFLNNTDYAYLNKYVDDLLISLPYIQDDVNFYMTSNHMLEGEAQDAAFDREEEIFDEIDEDSETPLEDYVDIKEEVTEGEQSTAEKKLSAIETYFNNLSIEDKERYNNGKMYYDALVNCEYTGYEVKGEGEYKNLLGLFMRYTGGDIGKYKKTDFYPFLHLLTPGQRALLKIGLPQLFSSVIMPVSILDDVFDALIDTINKKARTEADKIKKGNTVSVYKGVDREIFKKDNGIALTSEAITAAHSEPLEHIVTGYDKFQDICEIIAMAAGGLAGATILTALGMTTYIWCGLASKASAMVNSEAWAGLGQTSMDFFGNAFYIEVADVTAETAGATTTVYTTDITFGLGESAIQVSSVNASETVVTAAFTECMTTLLKMGLGIFMKWLTVASIGIMLLAFLVEYVYPLIVPEANAPYVDIPSVMCSYEDIFGQTVPEGQEPVKDYIYYYGLKNPFITFEDQQRAADAEGTDKNFNIRHHMIGDVANWTLKGKSRQWVAVYTSTDEKSGNPILADSLKVVNTTNAFNDDKDLIPVKKFHDSSPFDFHQQYAVTVNKDQEHSYLGYRCDNTVGATQSASVFSRLSLWGGIVAGLIIGGGIGTLATYGIYRKRKKKTVTE